LMFLTNFVPKGEPAETARPIQFFRKRFDGLARTP
jgi:hypothetical protein